MFFIELSPIYSIEIRGIGLVLSRRHDPQAAAPFSDVGAFADEIGGVRRLPGIQIARDEVDDSRDLFTRPKRVEGVEPGGLDVEIDGEYATAAEGEGDGRVHQGHRAADTPLEGIERRDVHLLMQPCATGNLPVPPAGQP